MWSDDEIVDTVREIASVSFYWYLFKTSQINIQLCFPSKNIADPFLPLKIGKAGGQICSSDGIEVEQSS